MNPAKLIQERDTLRCQLHDAREQLDRDSATISRVTAERDAIDKAMAKVGLRAHWQDCEGLAMFFSQTIALFPGAKIFGDVEKAVAALRARVAELTTECEHYLAAQVRLGQRNAELEAALRDLLECPTVTDEATCPNGDASRIDEAPEWQAVLQISCAWTRYKKIKALARAKSCTPAKHPDTERLDAIEDGGLDVFESHGEWYVGAAEPCRTLRAAIDAARKQETA